MQIDAIERALEQLRSRDASEMRPAVEERAIEGLKFSECVPSDVAVEMLQIRLRDLVGLSHTIEEDPRLVAADRSPSESYG